MKEYKIILTNVANAEPKQSSLSQSMRDFFFADNLVDDHINPEKTEAMMKKMNQEGWEVVSVSPCGTFRSDGSVLITFEREV